jgi:membrane fusion protein (multidrug efflux system)
VISAPTDGVVAKVEQLQVGDTIAASAPVFALVSTGDVWIEANFKEVQLARMRPGQMATVKIDRYPGRAFSAKVTSVCPSTGSQFSLLPPENATGNWVKVVQRVPVRLQLTNVNAEFLLQAGLSADVTVDTHSRDPELADAGPAAENTVLR